MGDLFITTLAPSNVGLTSHISTKSPLILLVISVKYRGITVTPRLYMCNPKNCICFLLFGCDILQLHGTPLQDK